jgi:hypothetical protein
VSGSAGPGFPKPESPFLQPNGQLTFVWYRYLASLYQRLGGGTVPPSAQVFLQFLNGVFGAFDTQGNFLANLLDNKLAAGELYLGNSNGLAVPVALTGDVTLSPAGVATVESIDGQAVDLTAAFTLAGGFATTLTAVGPTSIVLPTSGNVLTGPTATVGSLLGNAPAGAPQQAIAVGTNLTLMVVGGLATLDATGGGSGLALEVNGGAVTAGTLNFGPGTSAVVAGGTLTVAPGNNFIARGLAVPLLSSLTWINQAAVTAVNRTNGPLSIVAPASSSIEINFLGAAVPGTAPYTVTGEFTLSQSLVADHSAGIALTDGTKFITFVLVGDVNSSLIVQRWNSFSSFNSNEVTVPWSWSGPVLFLRVFDDGTDNNYQVSGDGVTYTTLFSEANTAFLAASQAGLLVSNTDPNDGAIMMNVWGLEAVGGTGTALTWT